MTPGQVLWLKEFELPKKRFASMKSLRKSTLTSFSFNQLLPLLYKNLCKATSLKLTCWFYFLPDRTCFQTFVFKSTFKVWFICVKLLSLTDYLIITLQKTRAGKWRKRILFYSTYVFASCMVLLKDACWSQLRCHIKWNLILFGDTKVS